MPGHPGMQVVVVTPNDTDRELTCGFLEAAHLATRPYGSLAELSGLSTESIGCIVLVEEALTEPEINDLQVAMQLQPTWSDLPILLVAGTDTPLNDLAASVFPQSGNITLLQRPLHPVSLVSAVSVALRGRQRQFQVRDLLRLRDRALSQRDEFLAMLGHELRNPLAPIRNAVYLLNTLKVADPLFTKCRTMIDKQARHITRLVDDLLDVSRLELGKVELRPQLVDLNECVAAAVEACVPMTAPHRHVVTVQPSKQPLLVLADPVRLEQAACNLIVNAAKFTPDGGAIDICMKREGDTALLSVADNGIGIKPEVLETIFELFTQSDVGLARSQGGLGIGLTLVKRLVELHGGTVRACSEGPGRGARFEARLPLTTSPATREATALAQHWHGGACRVLVVEDSADNRDSLGILLRLWNHEVIYAATGPDGLRRARETRPDVALIDIGLPGMDGYELARGIRSDAADWGRSVRLIALTGYGQASDQQRALAAGFDAHLLKPVDPAELRALLAERDPAAGLLHVAAAARSAAAQRSDSSRG